jgi:hypothetical protein
MPTFREQAQEFVFPDDWDVVQYDGTDHARIVMQNWRFKIRMLRATALAPEAWTPNTVSQALVDFVAWVPARNHLLLIEVKDYRVSSAAVDPVPAELADWVAWKARDTLAGLAVAATTPSSDLHAFSRRALSASAVRVFVDVKWPPSGLDPILRRQMQQRNLLQKLGPLGGDSAIVDPSVHAPWHTRDLVPLP